MRIEAGFRPQNQCLDDGDPADLGKHVVDQFHHEALPDWAKVDHFRRHGLERALDDLARVDRRVIDRAALLALVRSMR